MHGSRAPRAKYLLGLASLLAVSTSLTACAVGSSSSATAAKKSALRVVLQVEPPTLEPCDASYTATGVVVRSNITQPLLERDPTSGELQPLLATSWSQTSPTEWTFKLRSGVKFQNGAPFTAKDAAFSLDRALSRKINCNVKGEIFGDETMKATAVDDTTLTVTTTQPDPVLALKMSFIEIVPTSTSTDAKAREPVGTGPYKITSWNASTKLVLSAWPDYWGEQPAYKSAEYQWRSEGTVRAQMVRSGEADIATRLGPDDGIGDLGATYPNNETTGLILNGTLKPLTDIRIRRAINYAIDKQGIIDSLYKGSGIEVATQIIRSGIIGHNPDLKPWEYNPTKAKQLIAEAKAAGVPVNAKITMTGRIAEWPNNAQMAQAVQGQLRAVGLNVDLKMLETSQQILYQVRPFVLDKGATAVMISHGNQAGDAGFSTQYMLQKGALSTFGDPELDRLIHAAERATGEKRQELYAQAFDYEHNNVVQFVPLLHMVGEMGVGKSVRYKPNPATQDEMHLADMTPAS
jgi:peptide/nickel transport system substrate-binding protein